LHDFSTGIHFEPQRHRNTEFFNCFSQRLRASVVGFWTFASGLLIPRHSLRDGLEGTIIPIGDAEMPVFELLMDKWNIESPQAFRENARTVLQVELIARARIQINET
jgi:hypothetical protein